MESGSVTPDRHKLEFSLILKSHARVFKVFRPKLVVQHDPFSIGFMVTNKGSNPFPGGVTIPVNPALGGGLAVPSPILKYEGSPHGSYSHRGPCRVPRLDPGQSWSFNPWLDHYLTEYSGVAWFFCRVKTDDTTPVGHSWVVRGKHVDAFHEFAEIPFPIISHEEIRNRYRLYVVLLVSILSSVPAILTIVNIVRNLVSPPSGNVTG